MTPAFESVEAYFASFPPQVRGRLEQVREAVLRGIPDASERISYGIAAFSAPGGGALHVGGWTKHIGLYPVPPVDDELEALIAPLRGSKNTLVLPHAAPLPLDLVEKVASAAEAAAGGRPAG